MTKLPAISGWRWIKEGFTLFRKRPGPLTVLFVGYMFLMVLVGFVPILGQIIPPLLTPAFSMIIMTACAQIDQGREFNYLQLKQSFKQPTAKRLLGLGILYVFFALFALAISWLIVGGSFSQMTTVDPSTLSGNTSNQSLGLMAVAALGLLYIPVFWFAAPLIVWQQMRIGKAIFYSVFAVLRNIIPFIVYFLCWIIVGAVLPSLFSVLVSSLLGTPTLAMAILFLMSIIFTIVMYCSCYSSYRSIFGVPHLPQVTAS